MRDKVLMLENGGADYGAYFLTLGFSKLLGPDRIRMWPYKWTYEGQPHRYVERCKGTDVIVVEDGHLKYGRYKTGSELWDDPAYFRAWDPSRFPEAVIATDGPVGFAKEKTGIPVESDERIFQMIRDQEFGLIVLNGARWHNSAALLELQTTFGDALPPLAFCDHEDYPQLRWDFVDLFRPVVYFKRTLLMGGHPLMHMFGTRDIPVVPMPFASMWDIPWTPWKDRDIDLFCVFGATQPFRQKIKDAAMRAASRNPACRVMGAVGHPMDHAEYMRTLARSKVVIDHQNTGSDTVRHWEASAAGCLLVTDLRIMTPPTRILPGQHYYRYGENRPPDSTDTGTDDLEELLEEVLSDVDAHEEIAKRNYDVVRASHKPVDRAAFVLGEMEQNGADIRGIR